MYGLIFLSSWGCDTCAYCVWYADWKAQDGTKTQPEEICRRWNRRRTGRCAFRSVICIAVNQWAGAQARVLEYAIICGVGGMISQVGDLAASAIKRNHEIKDYGN